MPLFSGSPSVPSDEDFPARRRRMVQEQLLSRNIRDPRVLRAMEGIKRHRFVPADVRDQSYGDFPLDIGNNQTISQPYIVALMTELLQPQPGHRVLEIGTGSGYQTAALAELAGEVYTVERVAALQQQARRVLDGLGYDRIHYRVGDGYQGWPEQAPFDRIVVTAAPPETPPALPAQLADGGRLVLPVGRGEQQLNVIVRDGERLREEPSIKVRFVPLVPGPPGSTPGSPVS